MRGLRAVALFGPALGWMAVIYVLSAQPTLPTVGAAWVDRIVKALSHAGEYAVLAALLARPALAGGRRLSSKSRWAILALCLFYAVSDEYHQSFVPGRVADWADVAADTSGAFLSLLALSADRPASVLRRVDPFLRLR